MSELNLTSLQFDLFFHLQTEKSMQKSEKDPISEEEGVTGSEGDDLNESISKATIETPLFEHFIVVGAPPEVLMKSPTMYISRDIG